MGFFTKLVFTGLGLLFGGPGGGMIGYVLGSLFSGGLSGVNRSQINNLGDTDVQREFNVSLLVLSAAVMKADGNVKRSELNYVKQFFLRNFGQEKAESSIKMLREILEKDYNIYEVSGQVRQYLRYSSRLQLLHYLFGIADADGAINEQELDVIHAISSGMGIAESDFQSIKAMFVKKENPSQNAYAILGVDPSASDEEVKKAYREMAKKNHPDLVSNLGEEVHQAAEKKFQEINEAYELIKKQRGIN